MENFIPILNSPPPSVTRSDVEIFDLPLCYPTGLCGPTLDQILLDVNKMTRSLQSQGIPVSRYQMTSHPNAFLNNAEVMKIVLEKQMEALPITVVQGKVIKSQAYPSLEEVNIQLNGTHS